ncbi:hypothetical protein WG68_11415 [Arsukibacterium ikkense]|uniref:EAL domain-containing protein n=1 Tax=Arsukibacterium ikkense TaxID=336831 RepID=A0A0M2V6N7_9GAMM|nr:bifunctional diguanylate cyclase/phosphodiesterase [Arsukibacterium ikkense]KKO45325.1 hypothetical protein WG68_11415 [Arsukibacterium ikkense]
MLNRIKQLLLLTESDLSSTSVQKLQQSTLRIILSSGLLLVLAIAVHSSWQAYQANASYIIAITSGFYLVLLLALYFSAKSLLLSKTLLLFTVFSAGLCMLLFIDNFELSKLGVIFVYIAPVIAMLFFSRSMTLVVMLLNFIPYLYLMFGTGPINLFNISITLPATPAYLHSLLFLFFNLCIPLAVMRVISTLKRNSTALQQQNLIISQSNTLYQDMFNQQSKATLLLSSDGEILKANDKAQTLLKLDNAEQGNIKALLKASTEQHNFWLGHETECCLKANPSTYLLLNHLCRTQHQHHLVQLDNITPLKQLHQKLTSSDQKQNLWRHYDSLTSLPEHSFFLQLIKQFGECKAGSLMMIVRLCNVKAFNHAHSYQAGDELLTLFATEFQQALPDKVLSARLRGVKFILWYAMPEHSTSFTDEVHNIQRTLPKLLSLSSGKLQTMYEIGVSICNETIPAPELMLEQCEAALETADAYTRPLSYYQADVLEQQNQQLKLLAEFRMGLQLDTPVLWLQPKVQPDGTIVSFEALLRWQDNEGNHIAPDSLVALAERYGFMVQLSLCVLAKAMAIIKQFNQLNIHYPVAINLTGSDLLSDEFYNTLIDIATHQPQLLQMLSLELTENSVVRHQQPLFNKLLVLTRLGYDIALDDFGTGQASLSTLSQLSVSTVKLDRTFLQNIPADQRQTQLIQSVMQMAKTLKLALIIEGVETDIQRRFLQSLGAQLMQGYYFSRPQPVAYWLTQLTNNELATKQLASQ